MIHQFVFFCHLFFNAKLSFVVLVPYQQSVFSNEDFIVRLFFGINSFREYTAKNS